MSLFDYHIDWNVVVVKAAGIGGALLSMKFLQGSWTERVFLACGGALFSFYAAPSLSRVSGMPEGLSGFLLGLFGMAVVSKGWEVLQSLPLGQDIREWYRKKMGLEKEPK